MMALFRFLRDLFSSWFHLHILSSNLVKFGALLSPGGQILASESYDGTVQLWQVTDGKLLRTLKGHTDNVTSVAFSPDGVLLVSGSPDATVRLWGVKS